MAWLLIGIPGMVASYFWVMLKNDHPETFLINLSSLKLIEHNPISEAILAYLWVTVIILFHKWVHRGGFEETTKWEDAGFEATKGAVLGLFLGLLSGVIDGLAVESLGWAIAITLVASLVGLIVISRFKYIHLWYIAYGYVVVYLITAFAVAGCMGGWVFVLATVSIWIIIGLVWSFGSYWIRSKREDTLPGW